MYNIVSTYVNKMKKEDIINFANKNNLVFTNEEIDFVYNFIKENYSHYLKFPNEFDITEYKDKFSKNNYIFISNLINKYKRMII